MSDEEVSATVTVGGLTLCETKVYTWCKKDEDGKYRPIKSDLPEKKSIFPPILPPPPEKEWSVVKFSKKDELYETLCESGPPDLDDVLDGEIAEVIPIRPQEDE